MRCYDVAGRHCLHESDLFTLQSCLQVNNLLNNLWCEISPWKRDSVINLPTLCARGSFRNDAEVSLLSILYFKKKIARSQKSDFESSRACGLEKKERKSRFLGQAVPSLRWNTRYDSNVTVIRTKPAQILTSTRWLYKHKCKPTRVTVDHVLQ